VEEGGEGRGLVVQAQGRKRLEGGKLPRIFYVGERSLKKTNVVNGVMSEEIRSYQERSSTKSKTVLGNTQRDDLHGVRDCSPREPTRKAMERGKLRKGVNGDSKKDLNLKVLSTLEENIIDYWKQSMERKKEEAAPCGRFQTTEGHST